MVNVDELLHPTPFEGGASPAGQPTHAATTPEYLRGVAILIAYRAYFFPTMAVQWAIYGVWLQGHAAGLSLASLRAVDGQGRTQLAQYPREYHSPADLTESVQGLLLPAAPRALALAPSRPAPSRPLPRPTDREACLRWNEGRCLNGPRCRRQHVCMVCGAPHQVRFCRQRSGNGVRPLVPAPLAGRY